MKKMFILPLALLLAACGSAVQTTTQQEDPVNVGFGTVDRKNLTTSVATIETDNPQIYRNIYEMIEGKCAGVEVNGDHIVIRGMGTTKSSSDPLFVVNGVPTNSISFISPNDVKSITVLKDAASCAIYGSQGGNGVILIDLK